MSDSDITPLLRSVRDGDAAARAQLLALVREKTKEFLHPRAGPNNASDLTQDATIVVMQRFGEFRGVTAASFWKWVFTIARNEHLQDRRRDATVKHRPPGPLPEDSRGGVHLPSPEATPSGIVVRSEESDRVRAARAELTPDEQLVLQLRDDEGRDWPDVASALGRQIEATRKFHRRTQQKLATILLKGA